MGERNQTAGTAPFSTEVTAELLAEFRGFVAGRGVSVRDATEWMMRQLLAKPPPPGDIAPVAARGRGRPKKEAPEPGPPAKRPKKK